MPTPQVFGQENVQYLLDKIKDKINEMPVVNTATSSAVGKVKPDGTTVLIDSNGTISLPQNTIDIATSSVAGLLKPDGTTVYIKEDGTLYIKASELPPPPPPPEPIPAMPYLVALLTDGTDVLAIGYNKSKINAFADNKGLGSDGFINSPDTKHYINFFEWQTDHFREYFAGDQFYTRTVAPLLFFDKPQLGKVTLYKNNTACKALNYYEVSEHSYDNLGYEVKYRYNDLNIVGTDNHPGVLMGKEFVPHEYNILCSNNLISNGFYKIYTYIPMYSNNRNAQLITVDDTNQVTVVGEYATIAQDIEGSTCAFMDGTTVHIINDLHGAVIHAAHTSSTRTIITDTFVDENDVALDFSDTSVAIVAPQYFNGTFYAVCQPTTDVFSFCSYNLSTHTWKRIAKAPDSTSIFLSNEFDYVITNSGDIHYLIKNYYQKKITYYIFDHSTSEWSAIGECVPELWLASE